jgi:subtilase family serine protease
LSYIPKIAWNDSTARSLSGTGGGASVFFSKPSWQTGTGVPTDGARDVLDVSLSASANHDGFMIYSNGKVSIVGGTSVGAPLFAGITALMNQYMSSSVQSTAGLGNINPKLYSLAQTTPNVFHDITTGDNIIDVTCSARSRNCTPGPVGFRAGVGYDQVTGLGSVDVYNLVMAWNTQSGATDRCRHHGPSI